MGDVVDRRHDETGIGMPLRMASRRTDDGSFDAGPPGIVMRPLPGARTDTPIGPGTTLPELSVTLTPTLVVSTTLAATTITAVGYDPRSANARRASDVFLSIPTTMGLVERYVTDWAGPEALICGIKVKLGVPAYAGDRLVFSGAVASHDRDRYTVVVRGRVGRGDHVTGTVRLRLP
ncbi:acyl dehydratase [Thermostaphylospora chromogena]|uniref:MaoC like domain-containing protein n=1 Tax=Thermostaphylospora chromogena TaxID=35622 RepID=A0A1H1AJT4_9ACTN|nr:acyl dehydratase [Thermostaphylospora chromogena]SDQ39945.1 hypothetical protein SAMN04489764_0528 [Thermostaphylospora chromogena]